MGRSGSVGKMQKWREVLFGEWRRGRMGMGAMGRTLTRHVALSLAGVSQVVTYQVVTVEK